MAIVTNSKELTVNGYILSSELRTIICDTDLPALFVTITVGEGSDIVVLYKNYLHSYEGKVELYGGDTVIEQYMRRVGASLLNVKINFGQSTASVNVIYCEYEMPDDFDTSGLLVSSVAQRVHQDSTIVMAAINPDDTANSVRFDVVGHDSEGRLSTASFYKQGTNSGFADLSFKVSDIIDTAINMVGGKLVDAIYFSVGMGSLQKMCYIVQAPAYLTFSFRNMYNVKEYLDVEGYVSAKTESTRNFAICAGETVQYDRQITKTYEVKTAPIPRDEIAMYEQMLTSCKLELCIPSEQVYAPIIITDHKCEADTDDANLASFSFSFRFTGTRPRAFDSLAFGIMPNRRQVFTEQFTEPYE